MQKWFYRLTNEDFENLTEKICNTFPNESESTYYIPYIPKEKTLDQKPVAAKGKLIDKYRNMKRALNDITKVKECNAADDSLISTTFLILIKLV